MSHTGLGPGGEFDVIRAMLARWGPRARGVGDDAAIVDVAPGGRVVASTDTSVEDVHFRRAWLAPEEIGWRATMAALSDIAAMGAHPLGVLVALTVPDSWRGVLGELADGVGAAAEAAGAPILGGDLNGGSLLTLGITVLGAARAPLLRSGARPGDSVWVTGRFGGPAAALKAWQRGETPDGDSRTRFVRPVARIAEGRRFAELGATACIDVSDGLVADARHVAAASNVTIAINLDRVPVVPGASPVEAAAGGEEYELLVTMPPEFTAAAFATSGGAGIASIGEVLDADAGGGVVVTSGGSRVEFVAGYDHFFRA